MLKLSMRGAPLSDPHPVRNEILTLLAANGFLSVADLSSSLSYSRTAVIHHLLVLERKGMVIGRRTEHRRMYSPAFPPNESALRAQPFRPEGYEAARLLRAKWHWLSILLFIGKRRLATAEEIRKELVVGTSTVNHHLRNLQRYGLVHASGSARRRVYLLSPEAIPALELLGFAGFEKAF